uniref:Uncharacterized protein n=1 Tax=Arundo donax TaxID=35708 RepID=A0A0A9HRX7_ARUDO
MKQHTMSNQGVTSQLAQHYLHCSSCVFSWL